MSFKQLLKRGCFADFPACIQDRHLATTVATAGAAIRTMMAECRTQIPCLAELFGRFGPRGDTGYAERLLSATRKQFGGHDEKKEESGTSQLRKVT